MSDEGGDRRQRKGPDPKRVPTELFVLGWCGLALLVIGAALASDTGDVLANAGLLMTIGSAVFFFMRMLLARGARE